jgi:iron complex transport system substrate-binding protein
MVNGGDVLKVCSFLPGATDMIQQLGLEEHLHGVTFECPSDKPKIVRSYLEDQANSSEDIDRIVKEYVSAGKSLYYIDMNLLQNTAPDLIFTQHVCDVCQIGTSYVEQAIYQLEKQPRIVPLIPKTLQDVYGNALTIAREMGQEEAGLALLSLLDARTSRIQSRLQEAGAPVRRVTLIEWIDPIFHCGHWIPDQIEQAGGFDSLGRSGGHSSTIPWEKVVEADPEVIVIAPCGLPIERAREELHILIQKPGWTDITAVKYGSVYITDPDLFTRPSTSLIEGVELLAALLHPELFDVPEHAAHRFVRIA